MSMVQPIARKPNPSAQICADSATALISPFIGVGLQVGGDQEHVPGLIGRDLQVGWGGRRRRLRFKLLRSVLLLVLVLGRIGGLCMPASSKQ